MIERAFLKLSFPKNPKKNLNNLSPGFAVSYDIEIQFTLHMFVKQVFHFIFNKNTMNEFVFLYRGVMADGPAPSPEVMEAHMKRWQAWFGKLGEEGHLKDWGAPLQKDGKRVASGGVITDGPYSDGKEIIGGFSIVKAKDLAEAAKLAKGCPGIEEGGTVEVRQVQPM